LMNDCFQYQGYQELVWEEFQEFLYFYKVLCTDLLERVIFSVYVVVLSARIRLQSSYVTEFWWIRTHLECCRFGGCPRFCRKRGSFYHLSVFNDKNHLLQFYREIRLILLHCSAVKTQFWQLNISLSGTQACKKAILVWREISWFWRRFFIDANLFFSSHIRLGSWFSFASCASLWIIWTICDPK